MVGIQYAKGIHSYSRYLPRKVHVCMQRGYKGDTNIQQHIQQMHTFNYT